MPGAKCTVCGSHERKAAEAAIAAGESIRVVAKRLGLSYPSLDRHQRNCVSKLIAKARERSATKHQAEVAKVQEAVEARAAELGVALVERVERLQTITDTIIESAMAETQVFAKDGTPVRDADGVAVMLPNHGLALKAIAAARKNLELIGRLTGTLEPADKGEQLITFESFQLLYQRVRTRHS